MKIKAIKSISYPIKSQIRNAYIDFSQMNCSVIAIITDQYINNQQIIGYGFNSNGRYSSQGLLQERFIPRLLNSNIDIYNTDNNNFDPFKAWKVLMTNEKPGGHGERCVSVGVLDMALWDIIAKLEQKPLWKVFSERFNNDLFDDRIYVYAAGGYYYTTDEENDDGMQGITKLKNEMKRYLFDYGYSRVKMKIGNNCDLYTDMLRIETIINDVLNGDGYQLKVDSNAKFDLSTAVKYANELQKYNVFWFEEAGDPLDFQLQNILCSKYSLLPMATGENIFSCMDAQNLLLYSGLRSDMDWLHFDCVLSYGVIEYLRTLDMMSKKEYGGSWSKRRLIPHGGHQMNLHLCAGLQLGGVEIYPDLFQPFGGFPDGTILESDGYLSVVDNLQHSGLGVESKQELWNVLKDIQYY